MMYKHVCLQPAILVYWRELFLSQTLNVWHNYLHLVNLYGESRYICHTLSVLGIYFIFFDVPHFQKR